MENWKRFLKENREPWQDELDADDDESRMHDIEMVAVKAKHGAEEKAAGGRERRAELGEIEKTRYHMRDDPEWLESYKERWPDAHEQLAKMKAAGKEAYDAAMKSNVGNWEDIAFLEEVKTGTHGSEAGPTIPGKPEGWGKQPKPVDMKQFGPPFTEPEARATLRQLRDAGYDVRDALEQDDDGDGSYERSYELQTLLSMPRELADEGLDWLAAYLDLRLRSST